MGIWSYIKDGKGRGTTAHVEDDALQVTVLPCPPIHVQMTRFFRQFLTIDGSPTGTNDMRIDGSSVVKKFYVAANSTDRYITTLSFQIADEGAILNKFGNITSLTNGCRLYYEDTDGTEVVIHGLLKSNWDFVRLCLGQPSFGDVAGAFKALNVVGSSEAYVPVLNLKDLMPPFGVKLDMETKQKIILEVRDDTTGVDGFDCIAYGFERFT